MTAAGGLDGGTLDALVERQLAAGIRTLVVLGSTGEAAAFDAAAQAAIARRVVARAGGRAAVVVGTGQSGTWSTILAQKRAHDAGAAAALLVSPPYVRPDAEGLRRHVEAVAAACPLPTILYNVPARTGCDWTPAALAALAEQPGVVGVKEASGHLERVAMLRMACPRWRLWSGDDASAADFVLLGGDGCISVASNLVPRTMGAWLVAAHAGRRAEVDRQRLALAPVFRALAGAGNPQAVKAMMAARGLLEDFLALPLVPLAGAARAQVLADPGAWGGLG